jgi:hypothetical protein
MLTHAMTARVTVSLKTISKCSNANALLQLSEKVVLLVLAEILTIFVEKQSF